MIAAGVVLDDPALRQRCLDSLEWLLGYETHDGHLSPTPVSGRGPGDARPAFDQQPIEVATLADACARRGPRSAAALARGHPIACYTMMSDEVTISTSEDNQQKMLIGDSFHIGAGFLAKEHPYVLEALSALGPHLGRWDPDDVSVEVTLQDRR